MRILNQSFFSSSTTGSNKSWDMSAIFAMLFSLIFASVLNVFPVNNLWANLRPLFMFVVMLFWVVHRPDLFGIWFAFIVGVILDFLLDTRFGQQGFCAVLSVFILQYITRNSRKINDIQLWLLAALIIIIFSVSLLILQYLDGQVIIWRNGLPMITSILLWPVITLLLKRF